MALDGNLREHLGRLLLLATIAFAAGVVLLVIGFYTADPTSQYHQPFLSYILTNTGGILLFLTGYTLVNELFLKKHFAKQLSESIDRKLQQAELNESISKAGLKEVIQEFSNPILLRRMEEASSVLMLVMRSNTFLRRNHDHIRDMIAEGHLRLEMLLPDPANGHLMELLSVRYSDQDATGLSDSIKNVINTWIRAEIHEKLPDEARQRLTFRVCERYPLYSAYLFDDKELWYIPYHYRNDPQPLPVFVFRNRGTLRDLEIYKDLGDLRENLSQVVSLAQPFGTTET